MGNTALEILKSSLGFLTTLPVRGDVEVLRRNLWIFPYMGAFLGLLIAIPEFSGFWVLCIVLYVLLEGINHIDGLSDFGDGFFAPDSKKKIAMKDTKLGAGGATFLCVYLLVLYYSFQNVSAIEIIMAQILAKYSMLILLVTSKPSWEGMGAYFMEFAKKRDLLIGAVPLVLLFADITKVLSNVISLIIISALTFLLKYYANSKLGGIGGDIIGTANCISFASALLFFSLI